MKRDDAVSIAMDAGNLLSERDEDGHAVSRTSRVGIRPSGEGYDLVIPAEHVKRLVEWAKVGYPDTAELIKEKTEETRALICPETTVETVGMDNWT